MRDVEVPAWWRRLGLDGLVDVHVHFLPDRVLNAVWAYFDQASSHYETEPSGNDVRREGPEVIAPLRQKQLGLF